MKRPKDSEVELGRDVVSFDLVERCKRGDEQAWAQLVRATHKEVYTLCLRILREPDDAAEATQEAYVKVWRGLAGFRGDAKFTTWLYRVAANAAISRQRRRKRARLHETHGDDEVLAQIPAPGSTETTVAAKIDLEILERALQRLPEHYRSALLLRDVYGFSIDEIAKQLKISESATKVRIHRGRKKLKDLVFAGASEGEEWS